MPDKVIYVELTDAKEEYIIKEIESGMQTIFEKRQEIGFDNQVRRNKDFYDGIIDPNVWGPWAGSAKFFVQLITTHCDIISISALRQSLGTHPIMLIEPAEEIDFDFSELRDREDRLDYILRKDIEIEKLLKAGVYREACVQGASFVKTCHVKEVENVSFIKTYQPQQINEYKTDSLGLNENAEITYKHTEEVRQENIRKLQGNPEKGIQGEAIEVRIDGQRTIYYGPKAYRVPIEDLYLRPDIKDLQRQRLIAEKLHYTWKDIQNKLDTKYFRKQAVDKIRSNNEEDYFSRDYTLYECILYAKIDDKFQRYIITYEPDSKAVLRAIHYPYEHGRVYYVPYYIKERDDNVYGYSVVDIEADYNEIVNNLVNGMVDRTSLDNNPVLAVPKGTDLAAYGWGPNSWIPAEEGRISVLSTQNRTIDDAGVMGLIMSLAETADGVSAGQLSGQANPIDPRSPASKHAMQLQGSNFRIEDYIINLQFGNQELSFQVEELKKQYSPQDLAFFHKGMQQLDPKLANIKVRMVAHGTSLSINKPQEVQNVTGFMQLAATFFPEIIQDNEKRMLLLNMIINNMGGILEKKKGELVPEQLNDMDMEKVLLKALLNMDDEERERILGEARRIRE